MEEQLVEKIFQNNNMRINYNPWWKDIESKRNSFYWFTYLTILFHRSSPAGNAIAQDYFVTCEDQSGGEQHHLEVTWASFEGVIYSIRSIPLLLFTRSRLSYIPSSTTCNQWFLILWISLVYRFTCSFHLAIYIYYNSI